MNPTRIFSDVNTRAGLASPEDAAQPVASPNLITPATLSHQAFYALNAKETQGSKEQKLLASLANEAISNGQFQLSPKPNQLIYGATQFEMQHHQGMLKIRTKLNERAEHEILEIELEKTDKTLLTKLTTSIEQMPKELIEKILDSIPNGEHKSRVTSLATSSKRLFHLGFEKTLAKAKCSYHLDRLSYIDSPHSRHSKTDAIPLDTFKDAFIESETLPEKERLEVISALANTLPKLGVLTNIGFRMIKGHIEKLTDQKNKIPALSEDQQERAERIEQCIIDLTKGLSDVKVRVYIDSHVMRETYDSICSALLGIESKSQRKIVADICKDLTQAYNRIGVGSESFDRLAELVKKFGEHVSNDSNKLAMVLDMHSSLLETHNEGNISKYLPMLIDIANSINTQETRSKLLNKPHNASSSFSHI